MNQRTETTMRRARAFLIRCSGFFGKQRRDRDLAAEIESHLALHATENEQRGMNSADALREAVLKLGGVDSLKESYRDRRSIPMLETLLQDARYALRLIRKNRAFSAIAILILALGIGANVAIFSIVNAMLLRPLPYPNAERLVHFDWKFRNFPVPSVSAPEFFFWRDNSRSFASVAAYDIFAGGSNLSVDGAPQFIHALRVTQDFFSTLGVEPRFGRGFNAEETKPGGPGAAILAYGFWQSKFGGDAGVIGRQIAIDGNALTVVGILPPTFDFPTPADLWLPLKIEFSANDSAHNCLMIGRLRNNVSLEQARAEMPAIFESFKTLYPKDVGNGEQGMLMRPYQTWLVGFVRPALLILFGAVAMILLIAMVNVTSLLMAKASTRAKEMALRAALGASRIRLLRQMMIESVILAAFGGIAGLFVASWTLRSIIAASPRTLPSIPFSPFIGFTQQMGLNSIVIIFTAGITLLIGALVGAVASIRATRTDVNDTLKESAASVSGSGTKHRGHQLLVVAEIAFSVVLLAGAMLLIRSLHNLQNVSLGFDPQKLWSVEFNMPATKYPTSKSMWALEQHVVERLAAQPGITSVASASSLPLEQGLNMWTYDPLQGESRGFSGQYRGVSPQYFSTLRLNLLSGREFTAADDASTQPITVINEVVAHFFWKDSDPIGRAIAMGDGPSRRIVGVVANAKQIALDEDPEPAVYVPQAQIPDAIAKMSGGAFLSTVLIRAQSAPELRAIQETLAESDPTIAVAHYRSIDDVVAESITPQRFETAALAIFAILALVLSAVGIYGVLAYLLSQRTHEVGIRMALGAQPRDVLFLALKQGMAPVLIGVAIGLAGAAAAMRLLASLLFGVTPSDPVTFAAVAAILSAVALAACYIPARRATRIDPVVALRQ